MPLQENQLERYTLRIGAINALKIQFLKSLSGALNGVPHLSLIAINWFFPGICGNYFSVNICNFETGDLNKKYH